MKAIAGFMLFAVAACHSNSPPAAVVAPLVPEIERSFAGQLVAPEYVAFVDAFTAEALESLLTNPRYRLAPRGTPLLCPWDTASGMHGYTVKVELESLKDENAVGRFKVHCSPGGRGRREFATGERIQLRRRNQHWVIAKVLDHWIT